MENKEKLINEIHRNLQLMEVGLVNEQKEFIKKVFNKAKGYIFPPKLNLTQKLDDLIKNNLNIKKILDSPNSIYTNQNDSRKVFKNAYDIYRYNPNDLDAKYNLILSVINLEKGVSLIDRTNFVLSGLDMTYSKLSEFLSNFAQIKENAIPSDNDIRNYLKRVYNIIDTKEQNVYIAYNKLFMRYGSGKSKDLAQKNSIDKLTYLAKQEGFFELIPFWKQLFSSLTQVFKKNKSDLEIEILDKYAAYLDNIGKTDPANVEKITLAHQKAIDNTYRLYLMQQSDVCMDHIFLLSKQLVRNEGNRDAMELSKIINDLTIGTLGEKYPGFRITAILNSKIEGSSNFKKDLFLLGKAISPDYGHIYSGMITKILPDKIKFIFQNKYVSHIIRTQMWGIFPNTELIYRLISKNKTAIKNKKYKVLLILFIQYILYNSARNCFLLAYIPVAYTIYTIVFTNPLRKNYPDLFGQLTSEEQNRLRGNVGQDIFAIWSYEFTKHISRTFITPPDGVNGVDKLLKFALSIITPAEIKSFNNSIVANIGLWLGNKGLGEGATDYKSFTDLMLYGVVNNIDGIMTGIIDGATAATQQIQAGGTEVTVNTPTWSYNTAVTFPNVKFIDINFRHDKTKKLIVNGVNIDNFSNIGNKVRFSIRSSTTINSVKIIDTSNVTHDIRQR